MESTKLGGWRDMGQMALRAPAAGFSARRYAKGPLSVLVAQEPYGIGDTLLWHLSISHPDRYPGWEEIKDARYKLLPLGLNFAMLLPSPDKYINIHPNCFHLWEAREFAV